MVNVGDTITRDQLVLELETDKATIEVPSSVAGVVKEVRVKKGEKIKVGGVALTVDDASGKGAGAEKAAASSPAVAEAGKADAAAAAADAAKPEARAESPAKNEEARPI